MLYKGTVLLSNLAEFEKRHIMCSGDFMMEELVLGIGMWSHMDDPITQTVTYVTFFTIT